MQRGKRDDPVLLPGSSERRKMPTVTQCDMVEMGPGCYERRVGRCTELSLMGEVVRKGLKMIRGLPEMLGFVIAVLGNGAQGLAPALQVLHF